MASAFGTDTLVDSEDLMSWLLLNPDFDLSGFTGDSNPLNMSGFRAYEPIIPDRNPILQSESQYPVQDFNPQDIFYENISDIQMTLNQEPPEYVDMDFSQQNDGTDSSKKAGSISANRSRKPVKYTKKRPRESIEELEARVKSLKAENADLQAHLLNVTQRTTEVQKQRISMEKLMSQKLAEIGSRSGADQSELAHLVKKYTDLYADYGNCRQREVSFHLQQLEKLIIPTQTTKMCIWTLHQDKSFYQHNKSPMYDILCKELELTSEQTEKIQERREKINILLAKLKESLELIQTLKEAIEKKHSSYDHVCGRVQSAATAEQIVKFLIWISKNADKLAKFVPGFNRSHHYLTDETMKSQEEEAAQIQVKSEKHD